MQKKSVLITGASRGIGKSAAFLFASKGYHVNICGFHSKDALRKVKEQINEQYPDSCDIFVGDIGKESFVREMFQKINEKQPIDVLVNNAGIAHIGLLMDMTGEEWDRILRTNLSSVFYCCREAIPHMVSKKSGKIVNISSMWGTCGASCEVAYSAAKAGVNGLTKALAKELAPSNIQVNAIACGVIDTDMNSQLDEEERTQLAEEIPAGRFASPEEAAEMILDIVNSPAYMTGQIIGFDGGYV